MARPRLDLQTLLLTLCDNVYHQAPVDKKLVYPCIIYKRDDQLVNHADNLPYTEAVRYQVTIIDRDPDSAIPGLVAKLPLCRFDRHFAADNLNHDVYNLYF